MIAMIAGAVAGRTGHSAVQACSMMTAALSPWCRGRADEHGCPDLALAAVAGRTEESAAAALARSDDGSLLLAASVRIDNRAEIERGLELADASPRTDAGLLLLAWQRWGTDLLDQVAGDGAFAIAHRGSRELWLGRLPLSLRSMFFRTGSDSTLFASHPEAIFAVPGAAKRPDLEHAALRAGFYSLMGRSTMFAGVERVRPGEIVRIREGQVRTLRLWEPRRQRTAYASLGEAGEALRSTFDEVVASHLAPREGPVAAYLSGGRDSSAVVTSAAIHLHAAGERLLAYTGAPQPGFPDPSGPGWQADESDTASETARRFPAIQHRVMRPAPGTALRWLRRLNRYHHQPITNFSNTHWWLDINDAAQSAGASVMLSGALGNLTISAGPLEHLSDLASEEGWIAALLRAARLGDPLRAGRALLSPRLPPAFDRHARRLFGRGAVAPAVPVLAKPHRGATEAALARDWLDSRPARSGFALRRARLLSDDASDPFLPAVWSMEQRDPTADRRIVDLCFGVPAAYLVPRRSDARPLYRAAFGARLPSAVLRGQPRGLQGADWFQQFTAAEVAGAFEPLLRNPLNQELLDVAVIRRLLADWPESGFGRLDIDYLYPCLLLNALALADFIDLHWPA